MKIIKTLLFITIIFTQELRSDEVSFDAWFKEFRAHALKNNISQNTFKYLSMNQSKKTYQLSPTYVHDNCKLAAKYCQIIF